MKRQCTLLVISIIAMLLININNLIAQCWNPSYSSYSLGTNLSDTMEIHNNWKIEKDNYYTGAGWTIYTASECTVHSPDQYAIGITEYDSLWMFSRCFKLDTGIKYQLTFWYAVGFPDFPDQNLKVKIGNGQTSSSMSMTLLNIQNIDNNNYKLANIIFTVQDTGSYYIGWFPNGSYIIDETYMFLDGIALNKYVCDSLKPSIIASKKDFCHNSVDTIQLDAGAGYSSYIWKLDTGNWITRGRYLLVRNYWEICCESYKFKWLLWQRFCSYFLL